MASKILIGIALDGDSEVKRKLQEVGEAGKRSLENIGNKLSGGGGKNTALAELQQQATGLRAALAPLAEASGLGGLLGGAGLGGILGRLATGPAGIAAGISGALLGLTKIGEGAARARGRLASLGDAKGFDRLEERAKALGTDVANLQPRYEKFIAATQELEAKNQTIIHPPGFQPGAVQEAASGVQLLGARGQSSPASRENFAKFDDALLKQIRRDVPSASDAQAIADQFQQQLKTGGLTADALRGLQGQSPSAAKFLTAQLSRPLGRGFANPNDLAAALDRGTVQPLDQTKVINAGAKPNAEFDKLAAESRNVTQAFDGLAAAAGRLLEKLAPSQSTATGGVDSVTGAIDQKGVEIDQLKAGLERFHGAKGPGETFSAAQDLLLGDEAARKAAAAAALANIQRNQANQSPGLLPESVPSSEIPTDGRRYSRTLNPTQTEPAVGELSEAGRGLAAVITDIANAIRNAFTGNTTQTAVQRAGGGAVWGAGTATSDSIPAMLSHGEYVINANAASKIGLRNLDLLNRAGGGPIRLAEGGSPLLGALSSTLGAGSYDVQATDDGGAIINGVKYGPGSPILEVPEIKQALARARAQKSQDSKKTHKSDFVGIFGGHVFDTPGSYAKGGPIGHFAAGGIMPDFAAGAAPSLSELSAPGGGASMGHMDVDLRTNHGDFRLMAPEEVARAMVSAARDSVNVQTGRRPSWYRGR